MTSQWICVTVDPLRESNCITLTFLHPYFSPGISESNSSIIGKWCIVILLEEREHWGGQRQHHSLEDAIQGDEKGSKKQYQNVTWGTSMEGERAVNQAERKAKEHSLVTLTEAAIITSTCVGFRSSAAKPGFKSCLCSHLLCDLSSLSRKQHYGDLTIRMWTNRSTAWALNIGTACPESKTWPFPYLLSLSREGKKKAAIGKNKKQVPTDYKVLWIMLLDRLLET